MGLDPTMRASDADREMVAARLRDGHAEGRLTMEEFEARLEAAYAARTFGELVPLTRDLPEPAVDGAPAPASGVPRSVAPREIWAPWVVAVSVCVSIWLLVALSSGDVDYFWPMWVALPWGAVLLARTFVGGREPRSRPGRQQGERDHR